jgi:DNA-binding NarL/FixJ family response regulator
VANNVDVVGEAGDGLEALRKARQLKPDIILMDIKMPRCNGLEATRLIKAEMPDIKIVILTVSDDDDDLFEAIKNGAEGYLLKDIKGEEFLSLLFGVTRGEAAISPKMAAKMLQEFSRRSDTLRTQEARHQSLTDREAEVLRLVADGKGNKEIAAELFITESTVKYHLRNILDKLHMENRSQVIAYAALRGFGTREKTE